MSDETPSQSIQEQIEALERHVVAFEAGLTEEQKTDPAMVREIERAKATLRLLKELRLDEIGRRPEKNENEESNGRPGFGSEGHSLN